MLSTGGGLQKLITHPYVHIPEKAMAPHSSTLAWKIPWMRSLVVYSPWGGKKLDTTERLTLIFLWMEVGGMVLG